MRYRESLTLALVLLCAGGAAHAEPSRAYLKCQEKLENSASVHLERTNKIREKHERRMAELLGQASSRLDADDAETLRAAVDRIREWRDVEQARETYVEKIVRDVANLVNPDVPGYKCLDHGRVLKVYMGNQLAYEKVLEHVERDVVERIDLENLAPDEGLVIISYNATEPMTNVRINRLNSIGDSLEFKPLRAGQYYRVAKARAGTYAWENASSDYGDGYYGFPLDHLDLEFVVKPGSINYVGTFLLESSAAKRYSASLNDRLVIALYMLEDRYPELMGRYEIANGLYPDDRFTEFYLQERALYQEAAHAGD